MERLSIDRTRFNRDAPASVKAVIAPAKSGKPHDTGARQSLGPQPGVIICTHSKVAEQGSAIHALNSADFPP